MKNINIEQNGMTLVEMLLYIAISALMISALVKFGLNIIATRAKAQTGQEVNQAVRLVSERLDFEIKNASGINSVTTNSISLANSNAARNPTVFNVSGGQIRIGFGPSGVCSASTPCPLTSNKLNSSVIFSNLSTIDLKSKHIYYQISITSIGETQEYQETKTYASSTEIRSN